MACSFSIIIPQKKHKIKLHLGYKSCISFTKQASQIQKLRFVYKYSVVDYKDGFSFYKVASHLSINLSYKKFQKLLIDKNLKKTEVIKMAGISNATMARLNTNEYVSLEVIDKLCKTLECQPGDLLEYVSDEKE